METSNARHLLKSGGEIRFVWKLLFFLACCIVSAVAAAALLSLLPVMLPPGVIDASALFAAAWTATAASTILLERRPVSSVGLAADSRAATALLAGGACAAAAIGAVWLAFLAGGLADATWMPRGAGETAVVALRGALLCLLVGLGEELLLRGYILQTLLRRFGALPAVLATSLAFAALHCWNPSLSALALGNIALAGVVFGLVYAVTGSLWAPIGMHAAWNFTMGGVAGLPVSGLALPGLFATRVDGPVWLTGGAFGPEGGVAVTAVLAAGCAVWLLLLPSGARRALLRRP